MKNWIKQAMDVAGPIAGVTAGQVIADNGTSTIKERLADASSTVKAGVDTGIPLAGGTGLIVLTDNEMLTHVGTGMVAEGVVNGVEHAVVFLKGAAEEAQGVVQSARQVAQANGQRQIAERAWMNNGKQDDDQSGALRGSRSARGASYKAV